MTQPLVSVIVPVYNVERYLQQCLTSIVDQTYNEIEVIVVNDGSPDCSHEIIDDFVKKDSRIKVINKVNAGISAARNSGIDVATGGFIMFVDSDDWIEQNLVETLLSKISEADLVACSYNRSYQNNIIPRIFNIEGELSANEFKRRLIGLVEEELSDPSQADSLVTVWGKLYKTEIIKKESLKFVSTKEIGTCEDLLFNLSYATYINNVVVINIPLYNYRKINVSSFTSLYKSNLFSLWENLFNKIEKFLNKSEIEQNAFNNRIALSIIGLGLNEIQNPKGFRNRYKKLREILKHHRYIKGYAQLELSYFPVHWKFFFVFAKYQFVFGVYMMLVGINYIVNKNN